MEFEKQREAGQMICKSCGQFSSAQVCWTCSTIVIPLQKRIEELEKADRHNLTVEGSNPASTTSL